MYKEELEALKLNNLYRNLRRIKLKGPIAEIENKEYIVLCSNDYLGLSIDKRVLNAIKENLDKASQCSSRLVAGNDPALEELEYALAKHKGFESTLVYPNGYMANLAIASLTKKGDLILSDEFNHASIIDACKLSKADVKIFKHNDVEDLTNKMEKGRRNIVITEGVFSMDGDLARLREISKVVKEYDSLLILDDAHGDFIYGKTFKGTHEELDVSVDVVISSLSKALGLFGGYVASSYEIREYLINRSRSFIYTTALPSYIAAGCLEALKIVKEGFRQKALFYACKRLKEGLLDIGLDVRSSSHIIPIIVGDEKKALYLSSLLLEHGVFVQAIRYPTVPIGSARLRITLTSLHLDYVDSILDKFRIVYRKYSNSI